MWWVNASLAPAALWGVFVFGPARAGRGDRRDRRRASFAEWRASRLLRRRATLADGSAVLHRAAARADAAAATAGVGRHSWARVFAIALGKMIFGGLGFNLFNPALARAARSSWRRFPLAMTSGWIGAARRGSARRSTRSPRRRRSPCCKEHGPRGRGQARDRSRGEPWNALALGFRPGSIGEVSRAADRARAPACCSRARIITLTIPLSVFAGRRARPRSHTGAPRPAPDERRAVARRVLHGHRLRHLAAVTRRGRSCSGSLIGALTGRHPRLRRLPRGHLLRDPARQRASCRRSTCGSGRAASRSPGAPS